MSFHQGSGAITSTEDRRTRAHLDIPLLIITYALAIFGVYCIAIGPKSFCQARCMRTSMIFS